MWQTMLHLDDASLYASPLQAVVAQIFQAYDADGSGEIELNEFVELMQKVDPTVTEEDVQV